MLTTDLSNHLVLVTGATGGMGKATCLALAALGYSIAVHYNSATDTAEVVKQLESKGVKAKAFQANLGNYEDVEVRQLHVGVVSSMGDPSILFNNAGLTMGKSRIEETSDFNIEEFEASLARELRSRLSF